MAPATIAKYRDRPQLRSPVLLPCRHRASGRLVQSVGELLGSTTQKVTALHARQLLVPSVAYPRQHKLIEYLHAVRTNHFTATSSACKRPWKRTSGREIHVPSLASQVHILTKLPRILVLRTDQHLTAGLTTSAPSLTRITYAVDLQDVAAVQNRCAGFLLAWLFV